MSNCSKASYTTMDYAETGYVKALLMLLEGRWMPG
jgi:hypothetical protein